MHHARTVHWWYNKLLNYYFNILIVYSSEERIDCFVINLNPLRSDIEFISRKYWETLTNSLRSSILKDISILQDFLHISLQFLQNVPIDDFGINEAGAKYEKIMFELPKVFNFFFIFINQSNMNNL